MAIADIAQDEIIAIKAGHMITVAQIEQVTAAAGDPTVGFRGQVV